MYSDVEMSQIFTKEQGGRDKENSSKLEQEKSIDSEKRRDNRGQNQPENNGVSFTFCMFDLLCLISTETDDDDSNFLANSWQQCIITGLLSQ